jgi:hypothetical protein
VEIKDIDPHESMEDLKQGIASGLVIKDASVIKVKSLRALPRDAQTAVAVIPASYISVKEGSRRIRTGFTKATMRVLSKVIRCHRCHEIGHMANKCTISPGKGKNRNHTIDENESSQKF